MLQRKSPSATPTTNGVVTILLNLLDAKRAMIITKLRTVPARERTVAVTARTELVAVENIISEPEDRDRLQEVMVGGTGCSDKYHFTYFVMFLIKTLESV